MLICIDTLRADHISHYGYTRATTPHISHYFGNAETFEHAYTAASYTSGSVVSILSGLYPPSHGVRTFFRKLSPAIRILPDYLRDLGYQSAAIVSNTVLTDEALGLASRFDHYDDFVDERELNRQIYERRASRTTDAALRWLALERNPQQPHFLLLHYMDPHAPYTPPPDEIVQSFDHVGHNPVPIDPSQDYRTLPGITDGLDYVDHYDEEIAYVDQQLGRFLQVYERQGLLQDAILIFTADHGETLLEHRPYFEHSQHIWDEVLRVPMMVRWPGQDEKRNTTPVSLVDLVPSLLAQLGQPIPKALQGVPLSRRRTGDLLFQESWFSGETPGKARIRTRSVIQGRDKWTFRVSRDGRIQRGWYVNLDSQQAEKKPAPWTSGGHELEKRLLKIVSSEIRNFGIAQRPSDGFQITTPKRTPQLAPNQREALRALGYIE